MEELAEVQKERDHWKNQYGKLNEQMHEEITRQVDEIKKKVVEDGTHILEEFNLSKLYKGAPAGLYRRVVKTNK